MNKNSIRLSKDKYFSLFIWFLFDSTSLNNDLIQENHKRLRDNFFPSVGGGYVNFHASHLNIWNSLVDKYCPLIDVNRPEKDTKVVLDLLIKGLIMICNSKYNVRNSAVISTLTRSVPPIKESSGKLRGRCRVVYLTDEEKDFLSKLDTYYNR